MADHANSVAKKTAEFSKEFDFEELGKIAGLLHDIGKYQPSFQRKIQGQNCNIEHSVCGAKEALNLIKSDKSAPINAFNGEILAYIIAGHHSGLPDCGTEADNSSMPTLVARLNRSSEDYSAYKNEISFSPPDKLWVTDFSCYSNEEKPFAFSILTRMLFSSLVDGDSLETEAFYNGKGRDYNFSSFEQLYHKLKFKQNSFSKPQSGSINEKRNQIQQACLEKAKKEKGIYSLTVPTGGGKTLSSMVFAINHLLANGHKRIIYVIPYTSIIEQTAKIFKDIFGDENVLEHHSNFSFEDNADENTSQFLATENWDAPIVLTTNVQFFESFFSNKRGANRKLHNITNSVIIFDEAQMLPIPLLLPCIKTVDILTRNFGCTALFMSATCPDYLPYMCKNAKITEINEEYRQHYVDFQRVNAEFIGSKTNNELVDLIDFDSQTLVIVNTRRQAKMLFEVMPKHCNKYHLSTLMFPKNRSEVLSQIREDLLNNKPCVVVSTQLVECGVDLDFVAVYRSLAGIDSIVQAGGRCNREGKRIGAKVFIFESNEDPQKGDIPVFKSIARTLCTDPIDGGIFELANINKYFADLLKHKNAVTDREEILAMFRIGKDPFYLQFDFAKCNESFSYIDGTNKFDIIIPINDESKKLLKQVKYGGEDLKIVFRKLGQYTVSVYEFEYRALQKQGKLESINSNEKMSVLCDTSYYDKEVGLILALTDEQKNELYIV